jgi:hypothetical protein
MATPDEGTARPGKRGGIGGFLLLYAHPRDVFQSKNKNIIRLKGHVTERAELFFFFSLFSH